MLGAVLGYRVQAAELAIGGRNRRIDDMYATFNARIDRNAESTSQGFAAITSAIAGLDTRLAVLAQKFESMGKSVENGRRN